MHLDKEAIEKAVNGMTAAAEKAVCAEATILASVKTAADAIKADVKVDVGRALGVTEKVVAEKVGAFEKMVRDETWTLSALFFAAMAVFIFDKQISGAIADVVDAAKASRPAAG